MSEHVVTMLMCAFSAGVMIGMFVGVFLIGSPGGDAATGKGTEKP